MVTLAPPKVMLTKFCSFISCSGTSELLKPPASAPETTIQENNSEMKRTASGGFQTNEGTLYVSKPFRSGKSKKPRAVISFVPRQSTFDSKISGSNEFRVRAHLFIGLYYLRLLLNITHFCCFIMQGFFVLFWISLFLLVVQNYVASFERHGYPIELAFAAMFSRHAFSLALSDGVLVLSTGLSVPFAIALKKGWINYYHTGVIIQHLMQTTILFSAITWTFNR